MERPAREESADRILGPEVEGGEDELDLSVYFDHVTEVLHRPVTLNSTAQKW